MESDTSALFAASGDDDTISLSTVSMNIQTSPCLSFIVKKDLIKLLQELQRYEKNPIKSCSCVGQLWNICSASKDGIQELIRLVNEHNLSHCLVIMLESLKSAGYFSTKWLGGSDLWNTTSRLFDCVCLFSKYSEDFCISLINSGILCLLVDNLELFKDKTMLMDKKNSKPYFVMKATLCIVKNLARRLAEQRLILRKCVWTHLQHIKSIDELGVFATMGEVFLCHREEIKRKSESNETVRSLIYWINQSCLVENDPASWNAMFNLQDAIGSLKILANYGSADKFCTDVVLNSFRGIISRATIQDQIQTVLIIWTLCFDPEFEKLIKHEKIVKTLKRKEQSETDVQLTHCITAVLTIIKERYIPRSVSFEGNDASSETYALILYHKNNAERVELLQTRLETKSVTTRLNKPNEEDPKYFEKVVVSIHKCHSVVLCVSEFTELDNESRTIVYMAEKLNRDVIAVYIQKSIQPNGWVLQDLSKKCRFDFIESDFCVGDMAALLLETSIRFSLKTHGLRTTRGLGSLTGQSMSSLEFNDSYMSTTSSNSVFTSMRGIEIQGEASRASLSRLSLTSRAGTGPSSPLSPSSVSNSSSTISFGSLTGVDIPEKFVAMTKRQVSDWLQSLNIGINIRDFRSVNGRNLWELVTALQLSDQNSYHKLMARFKLSEDQKLRFTAALLNL